MLDEKPRKASRGIVRIASLWVLFIATVGMVMFVYGWLAIRVIDWAWNLGLHVVASV